MPWKVLEMTLKRGMVPTKCLSLEKALEGNGSITEVDLRKGDVVPRDPITLMRTLKKMTPRHDLDAFGWSGGKDIVRKDANGILQFESCQPSLLPFSHQADDLANPSYSGRFFSTIHGT